jgi:asparagine synthase (glutamine-hydrolysing)
MNFLKNVRGMFAFSIFDKTRNFVILGRDRLGEKPLYYAELDTGVWFASELTALMAGKISDFKISKESLSLYLKYGFIPTPLTFVEGIKQLRPGTMLQIDVENITITEERYWDLDNFHYFETDNFVNAYRDELAVIGESIFQGEAKIGIALSGGVDSSLIALLAKRYGKYVTCITIGYNSHEDYDESQLAASFSANNGLPFVVRHISPKEVGERYRECIRALDEPIADPSTFGYFILGEEASKLGIKVLLSGHGPDELFGGYSWVGQVSASHQRRMLTFSGKGKFSDYLSFPKVPKGGTLGNFLDQIKIGFGTIEDLIQYFEDRKDRLNENYTLKFFARRPRARERAKFSKSLDLDFRKIHDPMEDLDPHQFTGNSNDVRDVLINTYLQTNGLAQLDRLWMANSIEGRNLFVDFKLVEIALSDPENMTKQKSISKSRFIEYVGVFLDTEILKRKKRGFTPPVTQWYKEIYRQNMEALSNSLLVRDGILPKRAQKLLDKPLTAIGRPRLLWLELVNLELWYRDKFLGNDQG